MEAHPRLHFLCVQPSLNPLATSTMKTYRRTILLAAAALALSACGPAPLKLSDDKSPASFLAALKQNGAGFTVGTASAKPPVYVLFDPQCPHCGEFWRMTAELRKTRQFVWVPIVVLRAPANRPQGGALLLAKNPEAAMEAHEKSLFAHEGGISGRDSTDESRAKVDRNTEIAEHFDLQGVPTILVPKGNAVGVITGVPSPELFAEAFN